MNAPLRRVAVAMFVLFALLFVNLNYVQYWKGDDLRNDTRNKRVLLSEYSRERGAIVVDDAAIASAEETDGRLKYLRTYPAGRLYPHVTGYKSPAYGAAGIEEAENGILSGHDDRLFVRQVSDLVTGDKPKGGNVVLTLNRQVQQTAFDALGNRKGAVAALDPRTGEILGMVSGPTFDPNPLASHDPATRQKAWEQLNADRNKPLLNRALNESYPPGSTFKVIVSAAALKKGYTADSPVDSPLRYKPNGTSRQIQNFRGSSCGGQSITLERALTVSCNTAYSKLGVEELGASRIRAQAKEFGFEIGDQECPLPVSKSKVGDLADEPSVALSSIGQLDVRMTPLQGAMIASAVANDGELMKPYLVSEVQAPDLSILDKTKPETYSEPLNSSQAGELRKMMKSVVDNGTGKKARLGGDIEVGGKTGTAEDGDERSDHEWFIGYAIKDGKPLAAVAVVLENAGTSSSQAADVAGQVMRTIIAERGD